MVEPKVIVGVVGVALVLMLTGAVDLSTFLGILFIGLCAAAGARYRRRHDGRRQ